MHEQALQIRSVGTNAQQRPSDHPWHGQQYAANPFDALWQDAETIAICKGTVIFLTGAKVQFIYRLLSGRADIFGGQPQNNQVPLYQAGAGDFLVEAAFGVLHDATATCTTPGKLQRIPVARFRYLIQNDFPLAQAVFRKMAGDITGLRYTCHHRGLHAAPLRERILDYVATHADPASGTLELPYSQSLWARELGVAEETLSRTLRQLRQDELLEKPSGRAFRCLRGAT